MEGAIAGPKVSAKCFQVSFAFRDRLAEGCLTYAGRAEEALAVEAAVEAALESGLRTPDLASGAEGEIEAGTEEMTAAVLAALDA